MSIVEYVKCTSSGLNPTTGLTLLTETLDCRRNGQLVCCFVFDGESTIDGPLLVIRGSSMSSRMSGCSS